MDLVEALEADVPLTCVVGAGGKKSTLYRLAGRLERAVVTATVRIPIFDPEVAAVRVTGDPTDAAAGADAWPLGLVADRERADRYAGYDPAVIEEIAAVEGVERVLVKADGARTRLLKAPGDREPRIPDGADTVLALASVRAVGEPLESEAVHRPERVAAVTETAIAERIEPADVAAVLASPRGGLKDVPAGAAYVPVLNMVDDGADEAVAREIAAEILKRDSANRVSRVVLTSMTAPEPLVAVVDG